MASAGQSGAEPSASGNPQMIGDQFAVSQSFQGNLAAAAQVPLRNLPSGLTANGNMLQVPAGGTALIGVGTVYVNVPGQGVGAVFLPPNTRALLTPGNQVAVIRINEVPTERGPIKIAENESPMPTDRVFGTYNFFSHTFGSGIDANRYMIGFEKTFFDGSMSLGLRAPAVQLNGGMDNATNMGDLSFIFKYMFCQDCYSGSLLSGGMLITAPTGPEYTSFDGESGHGVTFQPYLGWVLNNGYYYLQGFSSVQLPLDRRDVFEVFNDVGLGYYAYLDCSAVILDYIVPTVEIHANNPLNHRDRRAGVFATDELNAVAGVHFGLCHCATLTFGGGTALLGEKAFDYELIAQVNVRF
jgi:hypothetical protein